jgi:hypothetical protein
MIASKSLKKVKIFKALKVSNLEAQMGDGEEKMMTKTRKFGEKLKKIDHGETHLQIIDCKQLRSMEKARREKVRRREVRRNRK